MSFSLGQIVLGILNTFRNAGCWNKGVLLIHTEPKDYGVKISLFPEWWILDFPGGSDSKASAYHVGDLGSIPGSGRSPGEGNGSPLQYSCLENPRDRGAWWASPWGHKESDMTERLHFLKITSWTFSSSKCNMTPISPALFSPGCQLIFADFLSRNLPEQFI